MRFRFMNKKTPNAERPTPNVECSKACSEFDIRCSVLDVRRFLISSLELFDHYGWISRDDGVCRYALGYDGAGGDD